MTVKKDLDKKLMEFKGSPRYIILSEANYYELMNEKERNSYVFLLADIPVAVIPNSTNDIVEVV